MQSFDAFIDSLTETDVAVLEAAPGKVSNAVTYPCGQCAGTGRYQGARVHQEKAHCFACRGKGFFKSSPEARAKHRLAARLSAKTKLERGLAAFAEQQPAMFADLRDCLRTNVGGSEFVYSLAKQLFTRGSLTENQIAAWHRGKAKLAEIIAQRAVEAEQSKVAVDLTPIKDMFEAAVASGLKKPAYRAEGVVLKLAAASGRNPGALYVTSEATGDYLGKVVGTEFFPLREAPKSVAEALHTIASEPKEAAVRWGRLTGKCSCCGRELTDKVSVANGIGPICAEKWGFGA